MAIAVDFYTKTIGGKIFAFEPGDISFGDGDSVDLAINRNGRINQVNLSKPTITFTIRGALAEDVQTLDQERLNNILALISGAAAGEDIEISGRTIPNALMYKVTPSAPRIVEGTQILEQVQVEYRSQDYA